MAGVMGTDEAAVPAGETHVADAIGDGGGAFQLDAGNDDWGAWVQVLGSSDTAAPNVKFDPHRVEISGAERNAIYFLQIAFGASGAAALGLGDYTESVFKPASNQVDSGPMTIQVRRQDVGNGMVLPQWSSI